MAFHLAERDLPSMSTVSMPVARITGQSRSRNSGAAIYAPSENPGVKLRQENPTEK